MKIENTNYRPTLNKTRQPQTRWLPKYNDVFQKNNTTSQVTVINPNRKHQIEYNGKNTAYVYKKVFNPDTGKTEKIKTKVCVGVKQTGIITTYYLFNKDTKKEIGYVKINDWEKAKQVPFIYDLLKNNELEKDYKEQGITGRRISIEYLQNNYPDEYSGIGEACDQIAIEYCLQEKIKPQIVSEVETGSAIAHFKRGRRFLPITKNKEKFIKQFGTDDPNKIIKERLKKHNTEEKIFCDDLENLTMYMPPNVIDKYLACIQEHKILN